MMLPTREFPEEDPNRAGLKGAAGTPAKAPADSGRGDAGKAAQADKGVLADKTVSADEAVSADKTVPTDDGVPAGNGVQAGEAGQAGDGMPTDDGMPAMSADKVVPAGKAAQADAEMVACDPPPATAASPEASGSAGTDAAMNVGTPASALSPDGSDSVDAAAGREWSDVLAMFVDDPRGSVAEASEMVDEAINALIAAARGRQASLAASWQAQDTDTEQLRVALRDYRTFWTSVTQLPQPA